MKPFTYLSLVLISPLVLSSPSTAFAAEDASSPVELARIDVTAKRTPEEIPMLAAPLSASISVDAIDNTVNRVDPEDALKYLPSVFLRKRNFGDTQATMATRVWGVSSSARSLVFVDGLPLSALIANNNTLGAPRWGLLASAEIAQINLLHGPFSAAYAGNSMGAVVEIVTHVPEHPEARLSQIEAWQHFHQYGTRADLATHQTEFSGFTRAGGLWLWLNGTFQDSHSQPLSYIATAALPAGASGGYASANKLGNPVSIAGAGGLLHTRMTQANFRAAFDFSPTLRAAYSFGLWRNDSDGSVESYLVNTSGRPTFAGLAGFASGTSSAGQEHSMHGLTLRSSTRGRWDFEFAATRYHFDRDRQWSPASASATDAADLGFSRAGRVADLAGTGWSTVDLKGIWRPDDESGAHVLTFGVHDDHYRLSNPTYQTADWAGHGAPISVSTRGDGKTRTQALWLQDAWRLTQSMKLTVGARYEDWRAYDGINVNGGITVIQPEVRDRGLSPKARLAMQLAPNWSLTASAGQAYRFATTAELYQLVSTGPTFTAPNPNLKPDDVVATELALEYRASRGRVRLSFFQDEIHDAILAQFLPLVPNSPTLYSYVSNVDHVRARGVELQFERRDVLVRGLEVSGSVTYLDARTLALSGAAGASVPPGSAAGKRLPNIPDWRAACVVSYHPGERWTLSAAGRYSGMLYTTLDNADTHPNTYQGFGAWFVADLHAICRIGDHWSLATGVDNVLNRKYFLFHPFPQRTAVAQLKYRF